MLSQFQLILRISTVVELNQPTLSIFVFFSQFHQTLSTIAIVEVFQLRMIISVLVESIQLLIISTVVESIDQTLMASTVESIQLTLAISAVVVNSR